MFVKSIVAVALLASFTVAQNTDNSTIDPNSVSASTRSAWCSGEINTCGTLCSGATSGNTCDPDTLDFNCTCKANSSSPGLQYYKQSMPTFICEQIFQNCIVSGQNDAAAQKLCTQNEVNNCGHLDPDNFTAVSTSSSSSSSPTATATAASSGTAAASASASATNAAQALSYEAGAGVMAAGLVAAFGFLL